MPEPSPDPIIPPSATPGPAPLPPQRDVSQRDVKPRRFGLAVAGILIGALVLVVVLTSLVGGGDSSVLANAGVSGDIRAALFAFLNPLFFIVGIAALIAILIGGFRTATALGDQRQVARGRRTLVGGIIVMVLLIVSYILVVNLVGAPDKQQQPSKITVSVTPASSGAVPFTALFTAKSTYPETAQYSWDFGDGITAISKSVSHEFSKPGIFSVVLTVNQDGKEVDSAKVTITVDAAQPQAKILVADKADGAAPLTVHFDATASQPGAGATKITAYEWDFGDPAATKDNPNAVTGDLRAVHTFTKEGSFTVTLKVTDDQKQSGTATQTVTVAKRIDAPTARVLTSPALQDPENEDEPPFVQGIIPLTMSFAGDSSDSPNGKITEFAWSFGDGTDVGRGRTARHTYERAGTFLAVLTVTDEAGKTATTQVQVRAQAPHPLPIAHVETVPPANNFTLIGTAPYKVSFDASSSVSEGGSVVAYHWDFGDGQQADGDRVDHTFGRDGEYFTKLTVTDSEDATSKPLTISIKVLPGAPQRPIARIRTQPDPATGVLPLLLTLDGSASTASSIVNYHWDFGDGLPSVDAGAQISHLYRVAGLYTARLTITDRDGATAETKIAVSVRQPPPLAKIEVDRTVTTTGVAVNFKGGSSLGNIQNWYWDFGDGTKESGRQLSHVFSRQGFYTVTLTVTDVSNQTDQTTQKIEVD